ncbi:hypothetical protein TNCV_3961741 [Trichonephila clavipes]|nr:hypothetical protein TNCV_3961741 [Trichonephila clavipes]
MLGYQPAVRKQIIPRGMCIGQAEPLNEGHLCVISDTSGCLDDQQRNFGVTDELFVNDVVELSDEQRNKLSELLRKFSGLFTKTDKSTAAKTNDSQRDFTGRECTEMSFGMLHCRECQRRKSVPQRPPGRLVPIPPAIAPFHHIGIDLLGRQSL